MKRVSGMVCAGTRHDLGWWPSGSPEVSTPSRRRKSHGAEACAPRALNGRMRTRLAGQSPAAAAPDRRKPKVSVTEVANPFLPKRQGRGQSILETIIYLYTEIAPPHQGARAPRRRSPARSSRCIKILETHRRPLARPSSPSASAPRTAR